MAGEAKLVPASRYREHRSAEMLWGLAVGGEAGIKSVLEMLRQKFDLAMALSACPRPSDITRDLVRPL